MKKAYLAVIAVIVLILVWVFVRFVIWGSEDSWIKGDNGVWIKHGNPSETPDALKLQQEIINHAKSLYSQKRAQGMEFESQCLGTVGDYAIDIVHAPRLSEDNLPENQCETFRSGAVEHFIELDKFGNVVRIYD